MTRTKLRILAVLMCVFTVGFTIYMWIQALDEGIYYEKASFLIPFMAFAFASVALNPVTKAELMQKYGKTQLAWSQMPKSQKILIILGLAAGLLNYLLLSGKI